MIDKKLEAAINKQINFEMYSAYLYLSMSAWFHTQGLDGFSQWLRVQYLEEDRIFYKDQKTAADMIASGELLSQVEKSVGALL